MTSTSLNESAPADGAVRVAAIDCGTNSMRLLVADVDPARGTLSDLTRTMTIVRLGQGVDRTGELDPEALERALVTTREYAETIRALGATRVRFVATSATRDARNREAFVDGVRAALGVEPEVVSGQEEAALSFRGATGSIAAIAPGPYLVVDLGGGSTEVVIGTAEPAAAWSMDIGSVRLTERHLVSDPPTAEEEEAARRDVRAALDTAADVVPFGAARTLVGLAGSVTTITAAALDLPVYDRSRVDGTRLSVEQTLQVCDRLLHMTRRERAALGFMHPGRVDVIGAGALVWSEVVSRVVVETRAAGHPITEALTSEHDILDGIAWSLVE